MHYHSGMTNILDASELTSKEIQSAYEALTPEDKRQIDVIADRFHKRLKARHTGLTPLGMGRGQILEVLAKLGLFMVVRKIEKL